MVLKYWQELWTYLNYTIIGYKSSQMIKLEKRNGHMSTAFDVLVLWCYDGSVALMNKSSNIVRLSL